MTEAAAAEELLTVLDRIVDRAEPGEGLEAFGIDETDTSVKAYDGDVESLSSARTRGVGIRLVSDERVGYAYTADLSEEALAEALEEARANARFATPDEANVLPGGSELGALEGLYDPAFEAVGVERKVELAVALEQATRSAAPEIKGVDSAQYGDGVRTAAIASTTGVRGAYRRADAWLAVEALAQAGGVTTAAYGLDIAKLPDLLDVEAAAREAATRAVRLLGGRKPASAKVPVVLDPFATASLLEVLGAALTADSVQRGRSMFAGRVGDAIAAGDVTLVDDGRRVDGLAAAPWDGEGVATGRTVLVEDGVLRRFMHNAYTAAKDRVASTGNASRAGFKSPPGVSPTNLFLEPGDEPADAILRRAGTGFYCQQIMGVHSGANPISGDFSVGAAGLMIRDGELAEPVREASIASTIPDLLTGIAAVGSDLRFLPVGGATGGTTLLLDAMTLSGA
jgi:PmbA protein